MIKTTFTASAIVAATTLSATAGGMAEPIMEPVIVVQEVEEASDGSGFIQWLILAGLVVAATAN